MRAMHHQRTGFTLIEILIVLGIIVAVAAIFVPVALNLTERNQVPKAASLLENALSIAKAKAIAERRPHGIRLLAAPDNLRNTTAGRGMAWYDKIQYIENPPDYNERWVWSSIGTSTTPLVLPFWPTRFADPMSPPAGFDTLAQPSFPTVASLPSVNAATAAYFLANYGANYYYRSHILFSPIVTSTGWTGQSGTTHFSPATNFQYDDGSPNVVFDGDMIEILGTGQAYRILYARPGTIALPTPGGARVACLILDRPLPTDVYTPTNGKSNFRIIRSPRVISSLPTVDLPQDVVIDCNPSFLVGGVKNPTDTTGTIFMSGVGNGNLPPSAIGSGITTTEISTITTAAANQAAPTFIDILFSPTGEVLPTSQSGGIVAPAPNPGTQNAAFSVGSSGLIALWLHQRGDPNLWAARQITAAQGNANNQALVSVNARTGFIGSYPINLTPNSLGVVDPLLNARLGKARISADTGQ